MPAHVDEFALKDVPRVTRMRGIDERVLRSEEVVGIVTLNRLVEKRQTNEEDERDDKY